MKNQLIVLAVSLLVTAVLGLFMYMSTTAPLHSDPQDVPSVTGATPVRQWAGALEQGRQIVPCGSHRAEPAGTFGGGRCGWRHRVGRRFWLGGLGKRAPVAPETLFRIGTASTIVTSVLSPPSGLVRFGMAINGGKLLQPATVQLLQTTGKVEMLGGEAGTISRSPWINPQFRTTQ